MKTGIEKFENIVDEDLCDLLIKNFEDNIDQSVEQKYSVGYNVICRQLMLPRCELDDRVFKIITNVIRKYQQEYKYFHATGDTNYQLRKITGKTREHIDNIYSTVSGNTTFDNPRNVSIILGLNSDYEEGAFHFPVQDFSTTVKRGEAIVFPVYFMYPHFVDAPIGHRYTINTWITDNFDGLE